MQQLARYAQGICLLALLIALGFWRNQSSETPLIITAAQRCNITFALTDFVRFYPPRSHVIPIKILQSNDCPFLNGLEVSSRSYHALAIAPAYIHQGEMAVKPREGGGISATLDKVQPTAQAAGWPMGWRARIAERINQHYGRDSARWLNALLLGNRTELKPDEREMLRRSGTSHLLAISGLHLGIFAVLVYALTLFFSAVMWRLRYIVEPRSVALGAAAVSGLVFVVLSGGQASVWRAWLMMVCVVAGWFVPWVRRPTTGLLFAAIIITAIDPRQLEQAGAWLSFMATLLVLLAWQRWQHVSALGLWWRLQAVMTLALLPLTWALFGGVSTVSFVTNLMIIPWLAPLWIICVLGVVFAPLASLGAVLLKYYLSVIAALAEHSWAYIEPSWQPDNLSAACGYLVVLILCFMRGKAKAAAIVPLLIVVIHQATMPTLGIYRLPHRPEVVILRQGRHAVLINAGYRHRRGRDDAERHLIPELRRHGAQIEAIILTKNNISHTSALKTWREFAPNVPIFVTQPMAKLPYSVTYCPKHSTAHIQFIKTNTGCRAIVFNHWQVSKEGVSDLSKGAQEGDNK